jgi:hypothetical protein
MNLKPRSCAAFFGPELAFCHPQDVVARSLTGNEAGFMIRPAVYASLGKRVEDS